MRRNRKLLSRADLRYARTWAIVMAIVWLAIAAVRISETGNRTGIAAWLAIGLPLLFIGAAVYYQNRLEKLTEDTAQVRIAMLGENHTAGGRA